MQTSTVIRSRFGRLAGLLAGFVALTSCATSPPPGAVADDSVSETGRSPGAAYGVVAAPPFPVAAPSTAFDPTSDLANVDGSVVVRATDGAIAFAVRGEADSESVSLSADADVDGADVDGADIESGGDLRAVSASGRQVALFDRPTPVSSRITVITRTTGVDRIDTYDLPGLIEPEAFSTDGTLLFVIDHEVSVEPGAYRVRPLNLVTGELETILGPTKVPFDDDMNGIGRRQVWSPDGTRLYTLYIRQTHHHHADRAHAHGEPGTDGFVHVLDLTEEWAFCLDLPPSFGKGNLDTSALAVAPSGNTIAIADLVAGEVAFASTTDLQIVDTVAFPDVDITGELQLGLTNAQMVVGFDRELHWFDRISMQPIGSEPTKLDTPLAGITSNFSSILAWSTVPSMAPKELTPPRES